jgi:hypothetical protein
MLLQWSSVASCYCPGQAAAYVLYSGNYLNQEAKVMSKERKLSEGKLMGPDGSWTPTIRCTVQAAFSAMLCGSQLASCIVLSFA